MKLLDNFISRNWMSLCRSYFKIRKGIGLGYVPDDVQWLATKMCNLNCAHCGTAAGRRDKDELSTEEIIKTIDELASLGTELLELTGGEPLLRDDLFDVLRYADVKGIKYSLVTNGTFVPKFENEFKKLPPSAIKVSVDGIPQTHNKIRNAGDNFNECMYALDFFKSLGVETRVLCTTLNQNNFNELHELFIHVRDSSASHWEFHLVVREGRALDNQDWMILSREQIRTLFRFIIENKNIFPIFMGEGCGYLGVYTEILYDHKFFCGCGWNTFTIMPNGDIAGCPAFEPQWIEGNLREYPVRWIWENKFERFRKLEENLPEQCLNCNYLSACGGGCWMMRRTNDHCYKDIWENGI